MMGIPEVIVRKHAPKSSNLGTSSVSECRGRGQRSAPPGGPHSGLCGNNAKPRHTTHTTHHAPVLANFLYTIMQKQ